MFKRILIVSIIILFFNSHLIAQEKMRLAVLELSPEQVSAGTARMVTDLMRTELLNTGLFKVLERGQMESILKEQEFQASGCTETECAVEIGRLLSARKILVGSVGKLGKSFVINARIVDVEKGEIDFGDNATATSEEGLVNATKVFANKLAGRITGEVTGTTYEPTQPVYQPKIPTTVGLTEWDSLGITREKYLKMKRLRGTKVEFLSFRKKGYTINNYLDAKENNIKLNEYKDFKLCKYKKINNSGKGLTISGLLISGIGLSLFLYGRIEAEKLEIYGFGSKEYEERKRYVNIMHSGVALTSIGSLLAVIGIPLYIYGSKNKKKYEILSYNITPFINYNIAKREGFLGLKYSF